MEVMIKFREKIPGLRDRKIRRQLRKVLEDLACEDGELSVLFTNDEHIAELNRQYLGRTGPTNVLAFPMTGGPLPHVESKMLGDVVVSVDTAVRESKTLNEPLDETIYRLLIHGLLHLLNYDHERSADDTLIMEKEEQRLLNQIREN